MNVTKKPRKKQKYSMLCQKVARNFKFLLYLAAVSRICLRPATNTKYKCKEFKHNCLRSAANKGVGLRCHERAAAYMQFFKDVIPGIERYARVVTGIQLGTEHSWIEIEKDGGKAIIDVWVDDDQRSVLMFLHDSPMGATYMEMPMEKRCEPKAPKVKALVEFLHAWNKHDTKDDTKYRNQWIKEINKAMGQ